MASKLSGTDELLTLAIAHPNERIRRERGMQLVESYRTERRYGHLEDIVENRELEDEVRLDAGRAVVTYYASLTRKQEMKEIACMWLEDLMANREAPEEVRNIAGTRLVGIYTRNEEYEDLIRISVDPNFPSIVRDNAAMNAAHILFRMRMYRRLDHIQRDERFKRFIRDHIQEKLERIRKRGGMKRRRRAIRKVVLLKNPGGKGKLN